MQNTPQHNLTTLNTERTPRRSAAACEIRDVARNLSVIFADTNRPFRHDWFGQRGSLGKAHELFGDRLTTIVQEMNLVLTA